MTNTPKQPETHGTVPSPKAPGEIEKVDPQTGGTHTQQSGVKPHKN